MDLDITYFINLAICAIADDFDELENASRILLTNENEIKWINTFVIDAFARR